MSLLDKVFAKFIVYRKLRQEQDHNAIPSLVLNGDESGRIDPGTTRPTRSFNNLQAALDRLDDLIEELDPKPIFVELDSTKHAEVSKSGVTFILPCEKISFRDLNRILAAAKKFD